MAFSH
jgi:phospholipid-transporting ATPase